MTFQYFLLNILLPLFGGMLLYVLLDKIVDITKTLIWFFSFRGRRAYRKFLKGDVIPAYAVAKPKCVAIKFRCDEYYAYMWFYDNNDNRTSIGIFNKKGVCLFAGTEYQFKEKSKVLEQRLFDVCGWTREELLEKCRSIEEGEFSVGVDEDGDFNEEWEDYKKMILS